jgi:hypothetical protein
VGPNDGPQRSLIPHDAERPNKPFETDALPAALRALFGAAQRRR